MKSLLLAIVRRLRETSWAQRALLATLAAGLCLVLLGGVNRQMVHGVPPGSVAKSMQQYQMPEPSTIDSEGQSPAAVDALQEPLSDLPAAAAGSNSELKQQMTRVPGAPQPFPSPLIAHSAELAVATKEFAQSRASLEEILERHRGYAARLRMVGQKSGSVLSATLRVPTPELAGTVSDLKALGEVEREEQSADEVTQRHADLEARLANARNTLSRLRELLKKQTYPDGNVRELQRQIANASAEVNRLEAEQQAAEHQVTFANLHFAMREEVVAPEESLSMQLHKAWSAGFGEAAATLSSLLVFLIGRGPAVVLWGLILYLPARFIWKKWQPRETQTASIAAQQA